MGFLGFRWLVNFGLLAVPIAATLGVLIGLQSHRDATGQAPLFTGDDGDDGTGDSGGSSSKNGIEYIRNCDKAYGITPDSKGQEYTRKSSLGRFAIRLERAHSYPSVRDDVHSPGSCSRLAFHLPFGLLLLYSEATLCILFWP